MEFEKKNLPRKLYWKKKKKEKERFSNSAPAVCFLTLFSQMQFPGTLDVVEIPQSQSACQNAKADEKAELKLQE